MPSTPISPATSAMDAGLPTYDSLAVRVPTRLSRRIDTRKLKTKMCAYVSRGKHCPYGDQCAFAHEAKEVPQPLTSPLSQQTLQSLTSNESVASFDSHLRSGDDDDDIMIIPRASVAPTTPTALPPPPSYEEVVGTHGAVDSLVPPAYPSRFRYDPYSYDGIMYVN